MVGGVPVQVGMGDVMVRVPTDDLHRISVAICFDDDGARHMLEFGLGFGVFRFILLGFGWRTVGKGGFGAH
jgi:hypothetical protein